MASEAYVERVFSVCGELTAGKRNRLTKSLEKKNRAESEPETIRINQQKNHTGIDFQSCANDLILQIKHNVFVFSFSWIFFNFRSNVIKLYTSVVIVFSFYTLMQISCKITTKL